MKTLKWMTLACLLAFAHVASAQYDAIETVFNSGTGRSGGYGAISNKFTRINGDYANMVEIYGGWFVQQKLLIGVGAAATTNYIPVATEYSVNPNLRMSYEYGQVGLVTEYVLASNKAVHVAFHLQTGAGFALQYNRPRYHDWEDWDHWDGERDYSDTNWFFVAEPGIQVDVNLLRWMRFSPGISYRFVSGSDTPGLSDSDLSGPSLNMTFKFGKF